MNGYRELLNARIAGKNLPPVFIFVDALPLIPTPDGWLKDLPLGFVTIDTLDTKPMDMNAMFGMRVAINGGCKERNDFVAQCVMAAKPKSLTVNTAGGDMEIWEQA